MSIDKQILDAIRHVVEEAIDRRLGPVKPAAAPPPVPAKSSHGTTCPKCGMEFEAGKAYGYYCMEAACPITSRAQ